jgi:hypothetical protein
MNDTIGIDISKDTLDTFWLSKRTHKQFANTKTGLRALTSWIREAEVSLVVFEATGIYHRLLGRVDGFDQDEGCGKGDEGSEIPFRFFTTQSDPLETFQFPDGLFDARPSPVERFGEYLGDDPGVLSERDHRHRSAVTGDLSVLGAVISFVRHNCAWQNVRSKVQQSLEMRAVRGLPASQIKSDGKPLEVCFQMDFCAEPAA